MFSSNCNQAKSETPKSFLNKETRTFFQPKLSINTPGDRYEHEADTMAAQVMRMRIPQKAVTFFKPSIASIQRKCAACEEEDKHIHRKENSNSEAQGSNELDNYVSSLSSSGQPLPESSRQFFEPRFGQDFSTVKIHTDSVAAKSAQSINALAYTTGNNIVFNEGQYSPHSESGQRLMAHELTHVVQQGVSLQAKAIQRQPAPGVIPASTTVYHPGFNHAHIPCGRWDQIQKNPNSGFWENRACANFSPENVAKIAINQEFSGKPIALQHINWYLTGGGGKDFAEDANIDSMLRTDTGIQALLAKMIPASAPAGGHFTGSTRVDQSDYKNQDFRFAFGAIDILDFDVDFNAGTVHAWFQDRYEWHPFYPGLYKAFPDDGPRETNCVHAAFVELQSGTARDFWMKGEATVPLSIIRPASALPKIPSL